MKSLEKMMQGGIDYAGLFPPAKLDLDTAIHNYTEYRQSKESWMMARFIIPASKLAELKRYSDTFSANNPPFRFSVIGQGGSKKNEFLYNLEEDLNAIADFKAFFGKTVEVDMLELPVPADLLMMLEDEYITLLIHEIMDTLSLYGGPLIFPFFELPWTESYPYAAESLINAVSQYNQRSIMIEAGVKLRCGGVVPEDFPSPEIVAHLIYKSCQNNLSLKATAGLHHPVRFYSDEVQTKMHGFLNIIGAIVLTHKFGLTEDQILEIIQDENPDNFKFSEDMFSWKKLSASSDEIRAARRDRFISYGSCSFDEPREDLHKLELL